MTNKTIKFPLKDGSEVEVVRPFSVQFVGQSEMLDPQMFECSDGNYITVDQIDGDKVTAEHARWFMSFSKEFYHAVSKAYRASQANDHSENS
ncbi:hypothetical protein [Thalassospira sp. MCCC 1A01428]|uniref:hypothetical protein n=1 Tax=Thalassospira sp. MCCC 1A01428 TaxID=1470575 RepID=UPI000A1DCE86|nr:hypothetical protein [Thalassospira sp. MCCC 1A01428]OSQ41663.1 hypothetical protein THS27_18295 [Thalassospira sp. MCCC 1A01428]